MEQKYLTYQIFIILSQLFKCFILQTSQTMVKNAQFWFFGWKFVWKSNVQNRTNEHSSFVPNWSNKMQQRGNYQDFLKQEGVFLGHSFIITKLTWRFFSKCVPPLPHPHSIPPALFLQLGTNEYHRIQHIWISQQSGKNIWNK